MEFAMVPGGQLPKELSGRWTSIRAMKAAAQSYLVGKEHGKSKRS